jgi:hypothetical protein
LGFCELMLLIFLLDLKMKLLFYSYKVLSWLAVMIWDRPVACLYVTALTQ